jgi:membrane protease YdiL (CAAX protease family)
VPDGLAARIRVSFSPAPEVTLIGRRRVPNQWCELFMPAAGLAQKMTFVGREDYMPGLSQHVKRMSEHKEVLFWLLLLGSWQCLAAPGERNAVFGAVGTAAFLIFSYLNLGKLAGLGLVHASWRTITGAGWLVAASSGLVAGSAIYAVGLATGQNMMLSNDWRLVTLHLTLGPVLEEVVFRGYSFALFAWSFRRIAPELNLEWPVVILTALIFAFVHLAQPGVSWLHLACISTTGTLYGWIRQRWGSTAPAAAAHAVYNLTLYTANGVTTLLGSSA